MKNMTITISISVDGKESKGQRAIRISETENGRKLRTRKVPDKRRKPRNKRVSEED